MSIFDLIPVAFRVIHRRDDISNAWQMLQPTIAEWNKVSPVVIPLLKDIANDIQPELLKPGGTVYDTKWVQETLNYLDEHLKVDGKPGPATEAAIRRFQEKHGLLVDGDPGAVTRAWLYVQRQKADLS
jgi:peptidoglycan hydrolase-like protein with peptidoglycan-binding domain